MTSYAQEFFTNLFPDCENIQSFAYCSDKFFY